MVTYLFIAQKGNHSTIMSDEILNADANNTAELLNPLLCEVWDSNMSTNWNDGDGKRAALQALTAFEYHY